MRESHNSRRQSSARLAVKPRVVSRSNPARRLERSRQVFARRENLAVEEGADGRGGLGGEAG
jgi:hypothetical protein